MCIGWPPSLLLRFCVFDPREPQGALSPRRPTTRPHNEAPFCVLWRRFRREGPQRRPTTKPLSIVLWRRFCHDDQQQGPTTKPHNEAPFLRSLKALRLLGAPSAPARRPLGARLAPALGARLGARLGALPGARRLAQRAARRSARRSAWRSARRLLGHPWWRSVREPAILDVSARICELATLYTEFVWLEEDRGRHVEVAPPPPTLCRSVENMLFAVPP